MREPCPNENTRRSRKHLCREENASIGSASRAREQRKETHTGDANSAATMSACARTRVHRRRDAALLLHGRPRGSSGIYLYAPACMCAQTQPRMRGCSLGRAQGAASASTRTSEYSRAIGRAIVEEGSSLCAYACYRRPLISYMRACQCRLTITVSRILNYNATREIGESITR